MRVSLLVLAAERESVTAKSRTGYRLREKGCCPRSEAFDHSGYQLRCRPFTMSYFQGGIRRQVVAVINAPITVAVVSVASVRRYYSEARVRGLK